MHVPGENELSNSEEYWITQHINPSSIVNINKPKQNKIKHAHSMECTVVVSFRNMHFIHKYIEQHM